MTTALYRRYRPETFQDVIGQSHVTDPLMTALRKNKVNHAYLFSGPRGCGKTTSARILARCLNCAEGPTPNPCGRCESCVDLSRDGAGSLDVIEMDAASHGGVDDARQLRERATFAPVRDRYKIFIIDEAHMVTRDGFNALLKIVEEPPEHIKFIFATTEPNKVLPTIRSRTHHYPFRLVPPEPLMQYLQQLCDQESVGVEPGVLAMVVRAGGGSVRDSLSVLDQLMAGTDADDVGYDLAVALLGYTHGALLDDVVDAFASGDAATVFRAVDRVIQTGQDPRRFVEDLLERFRDLVIVDAVPESAANILHGMPEDQVARLRNQAQLMGATELSRAADITNEALTEMTGATSPQLHLELLCARLLLPSAENSARGAGARIDRLERRLNMGRTGAPTGPLVDVPEASPDQSDRADRAPVQSAPDSTDSQDPADGRGGKGSSDHTAPAGANPADSSPRRPEQPRAAQTSGQDTVEREPDRVQRPGPTEPPAEDASAPPARQTPEPRVDASSAQGPSSGGGIDMIRASWTEVVNALAEIHRVSWMTVMRGTPASFDGSVLQLVFEAEGDRKNFPRFEPNLVNAIQQVLGVTCRVEAVGPGGSGGAGGTGGSGGPGRAGGPGGSQAPGGSSTPHDRTTPGGFATSAAPGSNGPRSAAQREEPRGSDAPREASSENQNSSADSSLSNSASPNAAASEPSSPDSAATASPSRQQRAIPAPADEQQDDAAPVDSWAVASIPTGDDSPAAASGARQTSPGSTPPQATPQPDQNAAPRARDTPHPRDADDLGTPNNTGNSGTGGVGSTGKDTDDAGGRPDDPAEIASPAGEAPASRDGDKPQGAAPGQRTPASASTTAPTSTGTSTRASRPMGTAGIRTRASDDQAVDVPEPPASPYDDIPWPDDPPPEDEPPFEDSVSRGRPSRRDSPRPNPRLSASEGRDQRSETPTGTTPGTSADTGGGDLPPEQWRPSSGTRSNPETADASVDTPTPASAASPRASTPVAEAAHRPTSAAQLTGRKPSFRERHAAQIAAAQANTQQSATALVESTSADEDFVPSDDDVAVENSGLQGRAMIEKILGGRLVEERPFEHRL